MFGYVFCASMLVLVLGGCVGGQQGAPRSASSASASATAVPADPAAAAASPGPVSAAPASATAVPADPAATAALSGPAAAGQAAGRKPAPAPPAPDAEASNTAVTVTGAQANACDDDRTTPECACERGNTEACLDLSDTLFQRGDRDAAIVTTYSLCQKNVPTACLRAAHYFKKLRIRRRLGTSVAELQERGIRLLQDGCAANDANACFDYGKLLLRGKSVAVDVSRGAQLLERACNGGHAAACASLANAYETGLGVKKSQRRALLLLETACQAGRAVSCTILGDKVARTSKARARALYDQACTGADSAGCVQAGKLYARTGDDKRAVENFLKACDLGNWASCVDAGGFFAAGKGIGKDPAKAQALYKTACDKDVGLGCFATASLVAKGIGEGVASAGNWRQAVDFYEKACALNVTKGCKAGARLKRRPPDWRCETMAECAQRCEYQLGKACTKLGDLIAAATTMPPLKPQQGQSESQQGQWADPSCLDARDAYDMGCDYGDSVACLRVGRYENACSGGQVDGCILRDFARHELEDPSGQKQIETALHKVCKQRRKPMACIQLARLIEDTDAVRAQTLLRYACNQNSGRACRILAVEYLGGISAGGTSSEIFDKTDDERRADAKAYQEAEHLLARACNLGDLWSCRYLSSDNPAIAEQIEANVRELQKIERSCDSNEFD